MIQYLMYTAKRVSELKKPKIIEAGWNEIFSTSTGKHSKHNTYIYRHQTEEYKCQANLTKLSIK